MNNGLIAGIAILAVILIVIVAIAAWHGTITNNCRWYVKELRFDSESERTAYYKHCVDFTIDTGMPGWGHEGYTSDGKRLSTK